MKAGTAKGAVAGADTKAEQGLRVEWWAIDRVTPYARNPRKNDGAVDAVVASLREFGWRQPIVVDAAGVIIVGHTRLKAARRLGMKRVPVHVADNLSPAQVKAYRLADNRSAEFSLWDAEALGAELAEIDGIDLSAFDFDGLTSDLGRGLPEAPVDAEPQVDQAEALRLAWQTNPGQLWALGDHRLLCGDATRDQDVARVLGGERPALMVTDPPYGVEYDPSWRNAAGIAKTQRTGAVLNDDRASWSGAFRLFPGDVAYVWHAGKYATLAERGLVACGFEIRAQIVWAKQRFALSSGQYHWRHEPCWYAVRAGGKADWTGDRKQHTLWADIVDKWTPQAVLYAALVTADTLTAFDASMTTVWDIGAADAPGSGGKTCHGTQKPVECMARPMRNHGRKGDLVYEPFNGSGSTILACEQTGRRCRAVELSPGYVAVALQRYKDATGRAPTLVS